MNIKKLEPIIHNIMSERTKEEWCLLALSNHKDFAEYNQKFFELQNEYSELKDETDKIEKLLEKYNIETPSFGGIPYRLHARVELVLEELNKYKNE